MFAVVVVVVVVVDDARLRSEIFLVDRSFVSVIESMNEWIQANDWKLLLLFKFESLKLRTNQQMNDRMVESSNGETKKTANDSLA